MVIPGSIVDDSLFLDAFRGGLERDGNAAFPIIGCRAHRNLQRIEALAGVAVADSGEMEGRRILEIDREIAEPPFRIGNGPVLEINQVV